MTTQRKVEVFSAGCPACEETIHLVHRIAFPSCEVSVLDMRDPNVASRAKSLGIRLYTQLPEPKSKWHTCCFNSG